MNPFPRRLVRTSSASLRSAPHLPPLVGPSARSIPQRRLASPVGSAGPTGGFFFRYRRTPVQHAFNRAPGPRTPVPASAENNCTVTPRPTSRRTRPAPGPARRGQALSALVSRMMDRVPRVRQLEHTSQSCSISGVTHVHHHHRTAQRPSALEVAPINWPQCQMSPDTAGEPVLGQVHQAASRPDAEEVHQPRRTGRLLVRARPLRAA